jgi:hypothetical protein
MGETPFIKGETGNLVAICRHSGKKEILIYQYRE